MVVALRVPVKLDTVSEPFVYRIQSWTRLENFATLSGAISRMTEPQVAPDPSPIISTSWNTSLHTLGMAIATAGVGIDGRRWCGSW